MATVHPRPSPIWPAPARPRRPLAPHVRVHLFRNDFVVSFAAQPGDAHLIGTRGIRNCPATRFCHRPPRWFADSAGTRTGGRGGSVILVLGVRLMTRLLLWSQGARRTDGNSRCLMPRPATCARRNLDSQTLPGQATCAATAGREQPDWLDSISTECRLRARVAS